MLDQRKDRDFGEVDLLRARQRQQQVERPFPAVEVERQPVRLADLRLLLEFVEGFGWLHGERLGARPPNAKRLSAVVHNYCGEAWHRRLGCGRLLLGSRGRMADLAPWSNAFPSKPIADILSFIQQSRMDVTDARVLDREIVQSRFGIKLRYQFGPDELIYTRTDFCGTHRCCAPYERIELSNLSYFALNNRPFTIVSLVTAILVFIVTLTVIIAYDLQPWLIVIPMWVVPFSFLMVRMHSPFSLHFALFPVSLGALGGEGPPIWLWDNSRGQEVMNELEARWRSRLRSLYASVDPANEARREVAKFIWLRANEIIDEAEYQTALGEIEVHCPAFGIERSLN